MTLDLKLNMSTLVAISNAANTEVCVPIGQAVAERARAAGVGSVTVTTEAREGVKDWAHTYVSTDEDGALVKEARTGRLARALGGA